MKLGIIGIGNVLFGDEGIGVHIAMAMARNYSFSHESASVEFIDGGTLAIALSPILASFDQLVIIDCIETDGGVAGDVYFFDYAAVPLEVRWDGSAHEVEMLQTLELMQILGDLPPTHILGIIPTRVAPMSFELSKSVQKASKLATNTLLKHLTSLGFSYEKRADYSVVDMANEYAKKGLA